MPVRLSPQGSLLISYDDASGAWVSLDGTSICILDQLVDIVPGTTIGHIFDIVAKDRQLKEFLAGYCSVNIDELHQRSREFTGAIIAPVMSERTADGGYITTETSIADLITVTPMFWVYTDRGTGERIINGGYTLVARSSKAPDCGVSFHGEIDSCFGHICSMDVRLDTLMQVAECDEDKQTKQDGETHAFSANVRYRLFDVLTTIYEFFGDRPFDGRTQREVDEDERAFDAGPDSDDATGGTSKDDIPPQ